METKSNVKVNDVNNNINKKNLKQCTRLESIDVSKLDLLRGDTPEDIKERCLQLCKDYLSGVWIQQTVDSIEVRRVSGGLSNQLYYCGISGSVKDISSSDCPLEVAVRLYGPKYFNNDVCDGNERLNDVINGLMVSESGLGPKIYGVFESGQIQAFYKHRAFRLEEQKSPKLVEELFKKLARVHAMDVPIKKTHWVMKTMDKYYNLVHNDVETQDMITELKLDNLIQYNLKIEIDFIKQLMIKLKSPDVFCHNDFRSSNIMVLEDRKSDQDQIVLCDFEYSSYGYRGHDFGHIMGEWNRPLNSLNKPYVFPDDSEVIPLIDIYRKESEQLIGKQYTDNPINSVEHILNEIKIFTMNNLLFFTLFMLKNDPNKDDSLDMDRKLVMKMSNSLYASYWSIKQQLQTQQVFDNL